MRALEKRPDDRYQSAEDDARRSRGVPGREGLRTGSRRVAIYMKELYAPGAAAGGAEAADDGEELDFDRRAPLSMRIEPAAEVASRPGPAATTRISTQLAVAAPPAAAVAVAAAPELAVSRPSSRGGWIVVAAFIVLGIAAMVILTLR